MLEVRGMAGAGHMTLLCVCGHDREAHAEEMPYECCYDEECDCRDFRVAQTSGPQCKNCGAFTTYARVNSYGMCMKCEHDSKLMSGR